MMTKGQYHLRLVIVCDDNNNAVNTAKLFNTRNGIQANSNGATVNIEQINEFRLIMSTVAAASDYGQVGDLYVREIKT